MIGYVGMVDFLLAIVAGIFAGYLVNYLADNLPITRGLGMPICQGCHKNMPWRAYLLFQPCLSCGKKRAYRSWMTMAGLPLAYVYLLWQPNERLGFWLSAVLIAYLALVAIIDLEYRLVLNPVSLVGVVVGLAAGWRLHGLVTTLIGGASGFLIMLVLFFLGAVFSHFVSKIRGEEIEEVALGFGDVNLSGILGLILGWPGITAGLFIAILLGGLVSFIYILISKLSHQYKEFTAIPYAPFLILGALILLFRP